MYERIHCAVPECDSFWDNDNPYASEKAMREGWKPTSGSPPGMPRVIVEHWWCPEHGPE